jgi:HAD superfamily hydrolase (TIGR01484 family)
MRYLALACDYDGTLAHHGRVDEPTLDALKRLRASGRELILVSGRELEDLQSVFDHLDLFGWAVLENGALLYRPATREEVVLAERPPEKFLQALRRRGVRRFGVGRVIVATWRPHETEVLEAIHECGLELQIIFNKDAVMVLPAGVTKATGLTAALEKVGLSAHNVVGVGDAENDHAFLGLCECSVAVANALPALKETADFVTRGDHGRGVAELIQEMVESDLAGREKLLARHHLLFGHRDDGREVRLRPHGSNLLFAGPSGSGKSSAAASLLERLVEAKYQFCLVDPEGDFASLSAAIVLGGSAHAPTVEEALQVLANPADNVVLNLVGLPITDRPAFFLSLLPHLQELRARLGRPHWLIADEAHHLFPASWEPGELALPQGLDRTMLITVHPGQVNQAILSAVDTVIAVGAGPEQTLDEFCQAAGVKAPPARHVELEPGQVLLWQRSTGEGPFRVHVVPHKGERLRHVRKYAEGQLPPDRSFYFRGPKGKLNLRAQNLMLFLQLADGVDDETWTYHLREGDYSRWFRDCIKDEELAAEATRVERLTGVTPRQSREMIRAVIEQRYTLPAAPTLPMPGTDAEDGGVKP